MARTHAPGKHPNSQANLKPVGPGEVRNPHGHNQHTYRIRFEEQIQKLLDEEADGTGKKKRELLASVLYEKAAKGEAWAMRLVIERLWPAKQEVEHSGTIATEQKPDLSSLSDEELDVLHKLALRRQDEAAQA